MTQECLDNDKVIMDEPETDEPEINKITEQKELVYSMIAEVDTELQEVVESFVEASSKAEEGNEVINKGINQMTTIRENFVSVIQAINTLGTKSRDIMNIVDMILRRLRNKPICWH